MMRLETHAHTAIGSLPEKLSPYIDKGLYLGLEGTIEFIIFFSGLVVALAIFSQWFSMMRLETHAHTTHVSVAIRERFWWFLISEAFLFVGFFWAYFHNALAPDFKTGRFPNFGIHTLDAWRVPLYNTMILISSGFTLTYGYHTLCLHHHDESLVGQIMAILQRFMFSYYQLWEYFECTFTISQGCWRSVFFYGHWISRNACFDRYKFPYLQLVS